MKIIQKQAKKRKPRKTWSNFFRRFRGNQYLRGSKFETLIEHSSEGIMILSKSGKILYASSVSQNILGIGAAYIPSHFMHFVCIEDRNIFSNVFDNCNTNSTAPINMGEFRVLDSNGGQIWIEGTLTNLHMNPKIKGIVANFRDITSSKLAEKKLQHKELRLSQAQAIAHIGSWEVDFETGVYWWSEEALRIFGLKTDVDQHSYETWISFIHPEDLEYVLQMTKDIGFRTDDMDFYHRIIRKDGVIRMIHFQSQFEFDHMGTAIGLFGVVHDVTEIKQYEEALKMSENALRESESRYRQIVESTDEGMCLVNILGNIIFVSQRMCEILEYGSEDLVGRNIHRFLSEVAGSQELTIANPITERTSLKDISFKTKSGKIIWADVVFNPILHGDSYNNDLLVTLSDITQRRQAETDRALIMSELVRRNQDLEQFSYIVSHNLRAPVANIVGLAVELNHEANTDDEKATYNHALLQSARQLDEVIIDLNSILKLKREIVEGKQLVSLSDLISNITLSIEHLIVQNKVEIKTDFSIQEIFTIKSYLHSIFYNLIINSIKYRQPQISPIIKISVEQTGSHIVIIHNDNGIGIDLERKRSHVFGLYKRFHHHTEGKGMGLFMVKTQVEVLGGTIELQSEVNQGATFEIRFPLI